MAAYRDINCFSASPLDINCFYLFFTNFGERFAPSAALLEVTEYCREELEQVFRRDTQEHRPESVPCRAVAGADTIFCHAGKHGPRRVD